MNNELSHYGVKGMKWGIRKAFDKLKNRGSKRSAAKEASRSEDSKKVQVLKKKKLYEMSNAELKAFNERMNLEKQYKQLSVKEKNGSRKFVEGLLQDVGKEIVKNMIKENINKAIKGLKAKKTS